MKNLLIIYQDYKLKVDKQSQSQLLKLKKKATW